MYKSRKLLAAVLALLMICSCETCLAGVYVLPSSVTKLDEEAFAGDTLLTEITLQSDVTSMGDKCFYGCSNLYRIRIPETVTSIGADCFTGCLSDLVIQTTPGSYAMKWALDHHADFQAGTKYRALLVAQTYDGEGYDVELHGPLNDAKAVEKCLQKAAGTAYTTKIEHNLTASGILSGIDSAFGESQDQDVSLFYYSGHGAKNGDLWCVKDTYLSPRQLRQKLDQIKGRKIIILDCCYSGAFITSESGTLARAKEAKAGSSADFLNSFMSAFSGQKGAADDYNRYYILAASSDNESSWETWIGDQSRGIFTAYLTKGLGYSVWNQNYTNMFADTNNSGAVTLREAYQYIKDGTVNEEQHVQVFPSDCDWISIIRAR